MINEVCPQCGCPPRYMTVLVLGRFTIKNGELGRLVDAKPASRETSDWSFECGGGHRWKDGNESAT